MAEVTHSQMGKVQVPPFPVPPPAGKALPGQSIQNLTTATGSIHNSPGAAELRAPAG